jgi:hypothetical protein
VPRGTYVHLDDQVEERFQCAPGVGGWRYVGERSDGLRTDLTVDSRWRQIRVQVSSGDLVIRGGVAGHDLLWVRGDVEHSAAVVGFLGDSPGFLVAVARSLRLGLGGHADVPLVRLGGTALATLTIAQRWQYVEVTEYETDLAPLPVERYDVTDLGTGEIAAVHLAGDVVLAAPGIELTELESPPNLGEKAPTDGP